MDARRAKIKENDLVPFIVTSGVEPGTWVRHAYLPPGYVYSNGEAIVALQREKKIEVTDNGNQATNNQ